MMDLVSLLKSMEEGLKASKMTNKLEHPEYHFQVQNWKLGVRVDVIREILMMVHHHHSLSLTEQY